MNKNKYFKFSFAATGVKSAISDLTSDNSICYSTGYSRKYEEDPTAGTGGRYIELDKFNQLMYDITSNIKEVQENGFPSWIENKGDGKPFAYKKNVVVNLNGVPYVSLIDDNTNKPDTLKGWSVANFVGGGGKVDLTEWKEKVFPDCQRGRHKKYAIVRYDLDHKLYQCKEDYSSAIPSENPNEWTEVNLSGWSDSFIPTPTNPEAKTYPKHYLMRHPTTDEIYLNTKAKNHWRNKPNENWVKVDLTVLKSGGGSQSGIPAGTIIAYSGEKQPDGWFFCDGRTFDADKNPKLKEALSEYHKETSTEDTVPDLRGHYLKCASTIKDGAKLEKLGSSVGHHDHTLVLPSATHSHDVGSYRTYGFAYATGFYGLGPVLRGFGALEWEKFNGSYSAAKTGGGHTGTVDHRLSLQARRGKGFSGVSHPASPLGGSVTTTGNPTGDTEVKHYNINYLIKGDL